jgi:2C-methyl-D-erythritol 2,4-cyclodiphosphate synthase
MPATRLAACDSLQLRRSSVATENAQPRTRGSRLHAQTAVRIMADAAASFLQDSIRANLCELLKAHPSVVNIKVRAMSSPAPAASRP